MLSLRHQFYLIDDAKVRQKGIHSKLFSKLFAYTGRILDVSQRLQGNLDRGQWRAIYTLLYIRKNAIHLVFRPLIRTFDLRSKVGCISEIKEK